MKKPSKKNRLSFHFNNFQVVQKFLKGDIGHRMGYVRGRENALRSILKTEQECCTKFLRLANALSAFYPKTSEEKRLLDAMLLAVPR